MESFTTPIEHLELFHLWSQVFTPEDPDPDPEIFLDPEMIDDGKSFEISSTFDYDLSDKDYVLLFCDITIRLPRIAVQAVRCSFKVNLTDFTDMFILENLRHPVSLTIFYAFDALKDICDEANLPFPSELDPDYPNVDDATLNAICNPQCNMQRHDQYLQTPPCSIRYGKQRVDASLRSDIYYRLGNEKPTNTYFFGHRGIDSYKYSLQQVS